LELADEYPETVPFLIPVYLDECSPSHQRLLDLHREEMFPSWDNGLRKLSQMFVYEQRRGEVGAIIMLKIKPNLVLQQGKGTMILVKDKIMAIAPESEIRTPLGWHDILVFLYR